ncbi:DUF975 family protein [Oscillospiraceae bacterium OttesenSCG-928-F05]|nr:DUF975 family protein [Oscillospiraceae bacterium OttesenSCG-928-F05]
MSAWSRRRSGYKTEGKRTLSHYIVGALKLAAICSAVYFVVSSVALAFLPLPQIEFRNEDGLLLRAIMNSFLAISPRQIVALLLLFLFSSVILGPLKLAFCTYFQAITLPRNRTEDIPESPEALGELLERTRKIGFAFRPFTQSTLRWKAVLLHLLITLRTLLWSVCFCLPQLVGIYFLAPRLIVGEGVFDLSVFNILLLLYLALLWGIIFVNMRAGAYYPAYFLLAENPDLPVGTALKNGTRLIRGRLWEFFVYKLSFLGWYILTFTSFGLALLYIVPYRGAGDALFMRSLRVDQWR